MEDIEYEYEIIRFHKTEGKSVVDTVDTREEAQDICADPDTHGADWFYGFNKVEK